MPAAGNHENEVGNGPQGHLSYQTRFELPGNGSAEFKGSWYAFTAGAIRVLSINNDDFCLQDGGFSTHRRDHVPGYRTYGYDPYMHGYSRGHQRAWLEAELASGPAVRGDRLDRGLHASGRHVLGPSQRRRPRDQAGADAVVRHLWR